MNQKRAPKIKRSLTGILCVFIGVFSCFVQIEYGCADSTDEALELQAAYLFRFLPFLRLDPPLEKRTAINFCVFSEHVQKVFNHSFKNEVLFDKPISVVKKSFTASSFEECSMVFLSEEPKKMGQKLIEKLQPGKTFVVGNGEELFAAGGFIKMYFEDNKLRFSVHLGNVKAHGVGVDARLLERASEVVR